MKTFQVHGDFHMNLEPETTTFYWLFQLDDSKPLHEKWLFHQTSIKKWLFGVPGMCSFKLLYIKKCKMAPKKWTEMEWKMLQIPRSRNAKFGCCIFVWFLKLEVWYFKAGVHSLSSLLPVAFNRSNGAIFIAPLFTASDLCFCPTALTFQHQTSSCVALGMCASAKKVNVAPAPHRNSLVALSMCASATNVNIPPPSPPKQLCSTDDIEKTDNILLVWL